jgi:hypothetical protein
MDIISLDRKIILLRTWQVVTILTCLYLSVIAFMQYNWYPDDQTTTYNLFMGIVMLAIITLRLLRPRRGAIPILMFLDITMLIIASRSLLNDNFLSSISSLLASMPGIIVLTIFAADYYLRFFYLVYQKTVSIENS